MRLRATIGVRHRTRIDLLAQAWGMTLAQTVRRVVILGLGGDEAEAQMANEECAGRAMQLAEFLRENHGVEALTPGGPAAARSAPETIRAVVDCAFPRPWARRIRDEGGLAACVARGLEAIGEGD